MASNFNMGFHAPQMQFQKAVNTLVDIVEIGGETSQTKGLLYSISSLSNALMFMFLFLNLTTRHLLRPLQRHKFLGALVFVLVFVALSSVLSGIGM